MSLRSDFRNKQGWLTKQGGSIKTWKRRLFLLHENVLYYYKNEDAKAPKGCIQLTKHVHLEKVVRSNKDKSYRAPEPFSFKIQTDFRTYWMCDKDEKQIDEWINCIQASLKVCC